MPGRIDLLGLPVDPLEHEAALDRALALARGDRPAHVMLPYVEYFKQAWQDSSFAAIWEAADLILPNGVALQWAAHYLSGRRSFGRYLRSLSAIVFAPSKIGRPVPARFDSENFTWRLLERARDSGLSVCLVGSPKGQAIEQTATYLQSKIPGLQVAGAISGRDAGGTFSDAHKQKVIDTLKQTNPDITLIGLGMPLQEKLISELRQELSRGLLIGEGGTFDYAAFGGKVQRAPSVVRKIGLEWLWRLLREPKRIKRQLFIIRFILQVRRRGKQRLA